MSLKDDVTAAIRRVFQLGQTYWQQADSESYRENAKSDATLERYRALCVETADIAARADARIAELERDIERLDAQWREELRIYRETDGVDAERYRFLRRQAPSAPGECKRHIAVHVYDWARSFDQGDRFNMWSYVELSGDRLDVEIDAARANGGGE